MWINGFLWITIGDFKIGIRCYVLLVEKKIQYNLITNQTIFFLLLQEKINTKDIFFVSNIELKQLKKMQQQQYNCL